jgi:ATP-dependent RNA helicase DDX52/ROK1
LLTNTVEIEKQLKEVFIDPIEIIIRGKMTVLDSIEQKLTFTGTEFGKLLEIKNIINRGEMDIPCLIFVQSKERVS